MDISLSIVKKLLRLACNLLSFLLVSPLLCCRVLASRRRHGRCLLLVGVQTHGNLGDQAILLGQYELFRHSGVDHQLVEITDREYELGKYLLQRIVGPEDLLFIHGGGCMGTLWPSEEYRIRDIVDRFPRNRILIFPQTIFYADDAGGMGDLASASRIYNSHPDLFMCAREERSLEFMRRHFHRARTYLFPDMALLLRDLAPRVSTKHDALLILRQDHEKCRSAEFIETIEEALSESGVSVRRETMVIPRVIKKPQRLSAVYKLLVSFSESRLVVTDRLHAMIFAAISGTPCIAFDNISGKVGGVYRWLQHLPYIHFVPFDLPKEAITERVRSLLSQQTTEYDFGPLENHFEELAKLVSELLLGREGARYSGGAVD